MTRPADASPDVGRKQNADAGSGRWKWAKRALTVLFFVAVPLLLFTLLKNLDWHQVRQGLESYKLSTLLTGVAIALASYFTYCGFDLLGRYYTGHTLRIWQVVPITFVCYAFTLNLSSWVGGVALRYRLYSRLGLDVPTITRILSLSLMSNWLGYMLLAGLVFSLGLLTLPAHWAIGTRSLQLIGAGLLLIVAAYVLACRYARRRSWHIRRQEITLPTAKLAVLQIGLGALNWSLMAALIYLLLPPNAFYPTVLGVLMISSIAGVITNIPAGLGVLEAVFISLMQDQIPQSSLLAALIGYRAIYFLLPLIIALVMYLVIERQAKR
ncbi:MAG: ybhN [Pseudomonas sp.]|nr:ybhN [Pseudomonas sp.]